MNTISCARSAEKKSAMKQTSLRLLLPHFGKDLPIAMKNTNE